MFLKPTPHHFVCALESRPFSSSLASQRNKVQRTIIFGDLGFTEYKLLEDFFFFIPTSLFLSIHN